MRSTISVERVPPSYASISIGEEVTSILAGLAGISDVHVESQRIDGVMIGFSSASPLQLARIHAALTARGMRTIGLDSALYERTSGTP